MPVGSAPWVVRLGVPHNPGEWEPARRPAAPAGAGQPLLSNRTTEESTHGSTLLTEMTQSSGEKATVRNNPSNYHDFRSCIAQWRLSWRPGESEPVRFTHNPIDWVRSRAADNSRGILLMAGGTLLTTATLVFIRLLGRDLPTAEIIFLRYAFALLAIAPWILRVGVGNTFATRRLGLHGIRGIIATISTAAWYYGITVVPLAQRSP